VKAELLRETLTLHRSDAAAAFSFVPAPAKPILSGDTTAGRRAVYSLAAGLTNMVAGEIRSPQWQIGHAVSSAA